MEEKIFFVIIRIELWLMFFLKVIFLRWLFLNIFIFLIFYCIISVFLRLMRFIRIINSFVSINIVFCIFKEFKILSNMFKEYFI